MRVAAALTLLVVALLSAGATGSATAARSEILLPITASLD